MLNIHILKVQIHMLSHHDSYKRHNSLVMVVDRSWRSRVGFSLTFVGVVREGYLVGIEDIGIEILKRIKSMEYLHLNTS